MRALLSARVFCASLVLFTTSTIGGCGLLLDTDPPDPQPGSDAGALDASARDGGALECTEDLQCDDGLFCTGEEKCERGRCAPGRPPCEGLEPACASVSCSEDGASCDVTPLCPLDHVCDAEGNCIPAPECVTDRDCPPDADANRCTGYNACEEGICVARPPVACPRVGCLVSTCDPEAGECDMALPDPSRCSRTSPCGRPICGPDGTCSEALDDALCADDGLACTVEMCTATGCVHVPTNSLCPGDSVSCTTERCAPGHPRRDAAGCVHVPDDSLCDASGVVAAGSCLRGVCVGPTVATSVPGLAFGCGVVADGTLCETSEACSRETYLCEVTATASCTSDPGCSDGDPCNGIERCFMGYCRPPLLARCPDVGCQQGYCELGPPSRCALRDTPACFGP